MAYAVGGDAGFTKSLAMSMGWGLLFATVLTLVVLPCMLLIQRDFMVFFERKVLKKRQNVVFEQEQEKAYEQTQYVWAQENGTAMSAIYFFTLGNYHITYIQCI